MSDSTGVSPRYVEVEGPPLLNITITVSDCLEPGEVFMVARPLAELAGMEPDEAAKYFVKVNANPSPSSVHVERQSLVAQLHANKALVKKLQEALSLAQRDGKQIQNRIGEIDAGR